MPLFRRDMIQLAGVAYQNFPFSRGNDGQTVIGGLHALGFPRAFNHDSIVASGASAEGSVGYVFIDAFGQTITNLTDGLPQLKLNGQTFSNPNLPARQSLLWKSWSGVIDSYYAAAILDTPNLDASAATVIPIIATLYVYNPRIQSASLTTPKQRSIYTEGDIETVGNLYVGGRTFTGGAAATDPLQIIDAAAFSRNLPDNGGGPSRSNLGGIGWANGTVIQDRLQAAILLPVGTIIGSVKFYIRESATVAGTLSIQVRDTVGNLTLTQVVTGTTGGFVTVTVTPASNIVIQQGKAAFLQMIMPSSAAADLHLFMAEVYAP